MTSLRAASSGTRTPEGARLAALRITAAVSGLLALATAVVGVWTLSI